MTESVERVPLTDEQLMEWEADPGLYGDWGNFLTLIVELRASRAREQELAKALSVALADMARCNGLCLTASDVGVSVPGDPVAHAHLSCPLHGDPAELGRRADRLLDEERGRTAAATARADDLQQRIDKALAWCHKANPQPDLNGDLFSDLIAALTGTDPIRSMADPDRTVD